MLIVSQGKLYPMEFFVKILDDEKAIVELSVDFSAEEFCNMNQW